MAATLGMLQIQVAAFGDQHHEGQTLTLDVEPCFADELSPGTTAEQALARMLIGGVNARGIANGLGMTQETVILAMQRLAGGARVDWTEKGGK
jgi:hypothetical protein